jgi:glyoxylase-like metal-dependent hydrolase (beta-lactamase superfamily II)
MTESPLRAAIIPVTPFVQNCSLVWCSRTMRGALVDPGGDLAKLKDAVERAGVTLEVIHCPGHTPGHVVFFHRATQFAFVGDVLFEGSIGRTDFPMGNHQDLLDSITQKLWPLGDEVTFVPGHGRPSTFGRERQSNPFVGDAVLAGPR